MTGDWNLGNDVVDLRHHGASRRSRDLRFLSRVFTEEERNDILSAPDPDRSLWIHWAGKEAIYKSVSKALGSPPVFVHSRFAVRFPPADLERSTAADPRPQEDLLCGTGRYEDLSFQIRAEGSASFVQSVSWSQQSDGTTPDFQWDCHCAQEDTRGVPTELRGVFSTEEWDCVTHRASALTRIRAREALAVRLGVEVMDLQIRCRDGLPGRRIPTVWLRNREIPVDLTLSHHGAFLAWAFLPP
jgi:hypothetical protein